MADETKKPTVVGKSIYIDKEDEEKLLKRKSKREDGMVYAHQDGASSFKHIENVHIVEFGMTVGEAFKQVFERLSEVESKIKVLKKVSKDTRQKINQTEGKVKKYVV